MNPINQLYIPNPKTPTSIHSQFRKGGLYICFVVIIAAFMSILAGCADDVLTPGPTPSDVPDSRLSTMQLPGVMGLQVNSDSNIGSRADNPPFTGGSFDNGNENEYDLADRSGDEYYNYLILYPKKSTSGANSSPLIFPIEKPQAYNPKEPAENVTYTISKVFAGGVDGGELQDKEVFERINTLEGLQDFVKNVDAYVVLNFKLDSSLVKNKTLSGSNTVERLSKLSQTDFKELELSDYKISASADGAQRNFFIMSSSVYSDGGVVVVGGKLNENNIFLSEDQAIANPAIEAFVERLASKVTVSFDTEAMGKVNFDPNGSQSLTGVKTYGKNNLPEIGIKVQKINMDNGTGIKYDDSGYEIMTDYVNASIKILGFGLSNEETTSRFFKSIQGTYSNTGTWSWTGPSHGRCYWAEDYHYGLSPAQNGSNYKKVVGYPHQFRKALETDTITSLHGGVYRNYSDYLEKYKVGEDPTEYTTYNKLGEIDWESRLSDAFLRYKSYGELKGDYDNLVSDQTGYVDGPLYTLENTYFDQGMANGVWRWHWRKAPYSVATNLIVLAEITFDGQTTERGVNTFEDPTDPVPTVYVCQNDIFYLEKENLLKSKLSLLNNIMLSGGNAGIQIMNVLWDSHQPGGSKNVSSQNGDAILDKVAWNEGSKLWFCEVEWADADKTIVATEESNGGTRVKLASQHLLKTESGPDGILKYLDLIPAEISGGDGQALIAPSEQCMGKEWRYYLAPELADGTMDRDAAVEINFNHLVALIHKIIGPVDVYTNGKMYFSVPVPHRLSSFDNTSASNAWIYMGAFSVVRNNWYNITVDKITGMGTPIHDLHQPIVPVMEVKRSYINMGVTLKNWHDLIQEDIPLM